MSKEIKKYDKKYDKNNNCIYYKYLNDIECWMEYDENNNFIHSKHSNGNNFWLKYDENNNKIHYKTSFGWEQWYKYDKNNNLIIITEKEYKNIEFRKQEKEYLSRTKCSRFELMEI